MIILPFYRVNFPIDQFPKEFIYVKYEDGQKTKETMIKEGDESYILLKNFLIGEKAGWRYDLNTYAPGYVFSSPTMRINCLKNALIVNYQENKNSWVQMSKTVKGVCPEVQEGSAPNR